jgi:predicted DNA-binding protein (MmcQ/YjbR family)
MDIETFRDYCLAKKGVTEGFPFGEGVLVFKVMGKMFALTSLEVKPFRVNLKMEEALVPEYRDRYADVQPGYHMNKKLWNSVYFDTGAIPQRELRWMVDHSYEQVVKSLTKKLQKELEELA